MKITGRERGRRKKGDRLREFHFLSTGIQMAQQNKDRLTSIWWKLDQVTNAHMVFQSPERRSGFGPLPSPRNQESHSRAPGAINKCSWEWRYWICCAGPAQESLKSEDTSFRIQHLQITPWPTPYSQHLPLCTPERNLQKKPFPPQPVVPKPAKWSYYSL